MKPIASLLISLPLLAQHTPQTDRNPLAGNTDAITAGRKLYEQTCLGCHGGEGRGGERAPALAGVKLKRGNTDGEIFQNVRGGVAGSQMPAFSQLSSDQTWRLVSYLRSLSAAPAAGDGKEPVEGDATAGAAVFNGKGGCLSCHQVYGKGVAVGPDLSGIGASPAAVLRAKIADPNEAVLIATGKRRGTMYRISNTLLAETKDGHTIRGVRRNEDSFSVQMVDRAGKLYMFQKSQLAKLTVEQRSLMPDDFGKRLAPADLTNLVAYLKTLDGTGAPAVAEITGGLSYERIRNASAEPQNWLTYWGDYGAKHYSSLSQITTTNVPELQAQWAFQMPGDSIVESVPLVVDGVIYTTGPPGQVFALDARSGRPLWKYQRKQKVVNPYESNRVNRGVAMLGNRLFFGTLDGALIALDARTGLQLWEIQVADTMQGYSITSAPLALKDKIITGIAGGEYGIRGFVDAYDPATGKRLWRFYTVPGPGEFGHETWDSESWKQGAAATWLTGTYDPELDLIYWPVGNPGPDFDGDIRKGDNLFSCSVVALDANTGVRKWHYQFTPNDTHDWDATEAPVLVDRMYHGEQRKLMLQPNRNGVFYVLDRTNGKFLAAKPYVRATWVKSWDENGRPVLESGSSASEQGTVVFPALIGGTNFQAASYSPLTSWMYFAYNDAANNYRKTPAPYEAGKQYWGGQMSSPGPDPDESKGVMAVDPETGLVKWKFELTDVSLSAGVLATGGGVVFAASREGNLIALDARSGKALWHFQTGGDVPSSPMSYSIDGRQYVAVSSANVLYSFALPSQAKLPVAKKPGPLHP